MIIELVCTALRGLNKIPAEKGVSDRISPPTIVKGQETFFYNKLQASSGEYAQLYEENGQNNTNAQRSLGSIVLSMIPNTNGNHSFMSLNTGKLTRRKQFTLVRITEEVKLRVKELDLAQNQPVITGERTIFEWGPNQEVENMDLEREDEIEN